MPLLTIHYELRGKLNAVSFIARYKLLVGALFLCVLVGGFFLYDHPAEFEGKYILSEQPLQRLVTFSGTVVASKSVQLAFETSGRIQDISVDVGDKVVPGSILARLDTIGMEAMLSREEAALEAEKAALAALERGTRPEEKAVSQAELDRAKATTLETREALLNALSRAYAAADTAIHKTADQLFDQPTILPRLLYYSKDSGSQPTLESTRQDIEILLKAWFSDIRAVVGNSAPSGLLSSILRTQLAAAGTLEKQSIEDATESARENLLTISYFLNELVEYARDIIPGANITQATVETYVAALTLERSTVLNELSTLNTAYKAYSDAERAESLASAQFNLSEAGSSNEDIRAARARVAAQEARVRELASERAKYLIRSPFAAVVVSRDAEEGELATAGVPVFTLDGDGDLEIDARISELDVVSLRVGDKADVVFDALEGTSTITATIVSIDPAETVVDGVAGYGVSLVFDAIVPSARPGMSVDVLIKRVERERALAAQLGYIRRDESGAYVQVVENGRITERRVATGITIPGQLVELVSGVSAGETLVPYEAR